MIREVVLVVEDDPGVRYTLTETLDAAGYAVVGAENGEEAVAWLALHTPRVVLTDLRLGGMDGLGVLKAARALATPPAVLLLTAHGDERVAVEAMRAGAADYFRKPWDERELLSAVRAAWDLSKPPVRPAVGSAMAARMVFDHPEMLRLAVLVDRVGARDVPVLITGESGTGKERVAEALVAASPRSERPFLRFNCASLTPELADAELFGHARGAFTGANRERLGVFREADRGTLLLDEVGELPLSTQAKLLRVLAEGEVRAVGEEGARRVDVRVLAATHRDLLAMVARGAFREDLYHRLHVVTLRVPPLRERREDIVRLAEHFADEAAMRFAAPRVVLTPAVCAWLVAQPWPGNVRELRHRIEAWTALSVDGVVDDDLVASGGDVPAAGDLRAEVDAFERARIVDALAATGGNQAEAARRLGIPRVTLHDKLIKHGLRHPS